MVSKLEEEVARVERLETELETLAAQVEQLFACQQLPEQLKDADGNILKVLY